MKVLMLKSLCPPFFSWSVMHKEYILVIEGKAPAIIVLQRCDSPNLSPPVLSDGQVVGEYCRQSVDRLGESHLWKMHGGHSEMIKQWVS